MCELQDNLSFVSSPHLSFFFFLSVGTLEDMDVAVIIMDIMYIKGFNNALLA